MSADTELDKLIRLAVTLEPDALAVLRYQAERMAKGQAEYGPLNLATSTRNWKLEQLEELGDWVNYRAMEGLLKERSTLPTEADNPRPTIPTATPCPDCGGQMAPSQCSSGELYCSSCGKRVPS